MTSQEKTDAARGHALRCLRCMPVVLTYRREIDQACNAGELPDALASKIRARLCREGRKVLDAILGVKDEKAKA